jgi:hypothetical protein
MIASGWPRRVGEPAEGVCADCRSFASAASAPDAASLPGTPAWKPSGILFAMVFHHGVAVSTGFSSPDARWQPGRSRRIALWDRQPPP